MNTQPQFWQMKSNYFAYENQGLNYDVYRPEYSEAMIQNILQCSNLYCQQIISENYLDLASGTGQVYQQIIICLLIIIQLINYQISLKYYFTIQNKLNGLRIAQDISEKQYQVLNQKIQDLQNEKCISLLGDSLNIAQQLEQMKLNQRFDLITIGQALHWFDFDQLMNYIFSELLAPNGQIGILSYVTTEIYLDVDELERLENRVIENKLDLKKSLSLYQTQFITQMEEIKQYFQCDSDNLATGYLKYDFKKYFSQVDFKEYNEYTPQTFDQVIKYLKTYSAYNLYVSKFPERKDPIIQLANNLMEKYQEIVRENNFKTEYPPLLVYNKYFTYLLKQ